ncbi:MAG TPA: hypothetical protein ENI06_02300 [Spirochaetales bacterium]|nr:hypothetical protein [Spirochaetales bacterium]
MKKSILIQLLLLLVCSILFATNPQGIIFSLRFFEKTIYYLGDSDYPIQFEATIINNSPQSYRFKIANNRVSNYNFNVITPTNISLGPAAEYTIAKNSNQPLYYREITLEPGEKYGIVIKLTDFIEFKQPGLYSVQCIFYPELFTAEKSPLLKSNKLSLNIRPPVDTPEERVLIEQETGRMLEREKMAPDDVVDYTIRARQKGQWEKFFLYMDLESLYRRDPKRESRYQRQSEEEQRRVLSQFRKELQKEVVDRDILLVPSSFEILKTSYTLYEATVIVKTKYKFPDFTEVKQYTYYLTRKDRFWLITGYDIINLGTE